ncbi:MAG TPA: hypothetical protein ENH21_04235, partial [Chromatiales bacterium]|nr:hypothetical protein [Chromatiales bacterium]HEX22619.1 hypothetical protein [Chromatiales bacterium]
MNIVAEQPWLWAGLLAYLVATLVAMWGLSPRLAGSESVQSRRHERVVLGAIALGVLLLTIA